MQTVKYGWPKHKELDDHPLQSTYQGGFGCSEEQLKQYSLAQFSASLTKTA